MYIDYNANPIGNRTRDCTTRAISLALGQDWGLTYLGIAVEGYKLYDMPDANHVWGAYLRSKGFRRNIIPDECPDCYTVEDFCNDHPKGTYILALASHVVAVIDGNYYDTWDSGSEIPIYYWQRREEGK